MYHPESAWFPLRLPAQFKFVKGSSGGCLDRSGSALCSGFAQSFAGPTDFRSRSAARVASLKTATLPSYACTERPTWSGQPRATLCLCPAGRFSSSAIAKYRTWPRTAVVTALSDRYAVVEAASPAVSRRKSYSVLPGFLCLARTRPPVVSPGPSPCSATGPIAPRKSSSAGSAAILLARG